MYKIVTYYTINIKVNNIIDSYNYLYIELLNVGFKYIQNKIFL